MRTLLTNLLPPQSLDSASSPSTAPSAKIARTYRETAVFASPDNLLEVGVDGTAIAAPSLSPAKEQGAVLERGLVGRARNRRSDS